MGLIYDKDNSKTFQILEAALKVKPMHHSHYMDVLLQLVAKRLQFATTQPGATDNKLVA